MKIAARCGEMLPHHKALFIPPLLRGTTDPEPLIRASSMSALGTVCAQLRCVLAPP